MHMDERGRLANTTEPPPTSLAEFDEAKYLPYLDDIDLDEAQKRELMRLVWAIMRTWVVMDLPMDSCGQIIEALLDPNANDSGDVK